MTLQKIVIILNLSVDNSRMLYGADLSKAVRLFSNTYCLFKGFLGYFPQFLSFRLTEQREHFPTSCFSPSPQSSGLSNDLFTIY